MSNPSKNTKEVTYSIHNIKSYLDGVKKIYLKRRSDGAPSGEKLCLYKSNSNAETADSNNQKDKKLCIKFKDFVAEEENNKDEDELELALKIKKRRYTNNPKKIYKCNNKINLLNEKEKEKEEKNNREKILKISKSMGKVIIDDDKNSLIQKIKRKILCC